MKKATQTASPAVKKLYVKIRKTANQLDKMLVQMHKLILVNRSKSKSRRRRLH